MDFIKPFSNRFFLSISTFFLVFQNQAHANNIDYQTEDYSDVDAQDAESFSESDLQDSLNQDLVEDLQNYYFDNDVVFELYQKGESGGPNAEHPGDKSGKGTKSKRKWRKKKSSNSTNATAGRDRSGT